jgi:hypothetical protein
MATVSRSLFLAGGGQFNGVASFGNVFFGTASNQYAILTVFPGSGGTLNMGNIAIPYPSGEPYEIHVPPSFNVYAEGAGLFTYILSWIIFQST